MVHKWPTPCEVLVEDSDSEIHNYLFLNQFLWRLSLSGDVLSLIRSFLFHMLLLCLSQFCPSTVAQREVSKQDLLYHNPARTQVQLELSPAQTGLTQCGLEGTPWQEGAEQAPSVAVLAEQLNNLSLSGATELTQVLGWIKFFCSLWDTHREKHLNNWEIKYSLIYIFLSLRNVHVIPCPTCKGRVSCAADLATYFQITTRRKKHSRRIQLWPERNLINFIKLWDDLVKTSAMWMCAEAFRVREDTQIQIPVSLQLLSAEVTLRWDTPGCLQELWRLCELSSAHWAAVPVHRSGLRLCSEFVWEPDDTGKPFKEAAQLVWCAGLPSSCSFVTLFCCKMVQRAAMQKCGHKEYLHRFSKNRIFS